METRLKQRLSRMFRSSFGSCRSRNFSDVVEKAIFSPPNHRRYFQDLQPLPSPKAQLFPSVYKPNCSQSAPHHCVGDARPRRKLSAAGISPFVFSADSDGRTYPFVSPSSPFFKSEDFCFYEGNQRKKKDDKKTPKTERTVNKTKTTLVNFLSQDNGSWWFNSEDDDEEREEETETIFSSMSLTSDSSGSRRRRNSRRRMVEGQARVSPPEMGTTKVKDSFAIVKSSSDPYDDFRTSMVEMILEKQIFAARDLEQLLQCFLSLNSHHHHRIILDVFTEIYEALFSD